MTGQDFWQDVAVITRWLDDNPPEFGNWIQWRIGKIAEELGEVQAALIQAGNANPRKAGGRRVRVDMTDVSDELCDVIITACVALDGIDAQAARRLDARMISIRGRVSASEPAPADLAPSQAATDD